ncbi:MAG: hypothetical protein HQM01_04455 [Magnetococcales bacterium]|nr:hypothetical protein [Magnetococcales bacterium]
MDTNLTLTDIFIFFGNNNIPWDCPICRHPKWELIGPRKDSNDIPIIDIEMSKVFGKNDILGGLQSNPDNQPLEDHVMDMVDKFEGSFPQPIKLPAVVMVCGKCGFVRSHSANFLLRNRKSDNESPK